MILNQLMNKSLFWQYNDLLFNLFYWLPVKFTVRILCHIWVFFRDWDSTAATEWKWKQIIRIIRIDKISIYIVLSIGYFVTEEIYITPRMIPDHCAEKISRRILPVVVYSSYVAKFTSCWYLSIITRTMLCLITSTVTILLCQNRCIMTWNSRDLRYWKSKHAPDLTLNRVCFLWPSVEIYAGVFNFNTLGTQNNIDSNIFFCQKKKSFPELTKCYFLFHVKHTKWNK